MNTVSIQGELFNCMAAIKILKTSVDIKKMSKAAVQMLSSSRMSCTSNKGKTTRHWELNVVWKCNIYIHSF